MKRHMPELYEGLLQINSCLDANRKATADRIFTGLTKISIDHGLMQKADNVMMVPARFAWDDIGTWASLARASIADKHGNYKKGSVVSIDTKGCVIHGKDVMIGTIGVSGLVVVATKDSVLVCDIERVQEVREIAKKLSAGTEKK
jgi:mannose-1-phosphate guanylyltransferase